MSSVTDRTLVDTAKALHDTLRVIHDSKDDSPLKSPLLYVDLEGNDLCRYGSLSLVQIFIPVIGRTYVIDVVALGKEVFTTSVFITSPANTDVSLSDIVVSSSPSAVTRTSVDAIVSSLNSVALSEPVDTEVKAIEVSLKTILESENYVKCFYDIRNDADALYCLFGVAMKGVVDLQLLENASRRGSKKFLNGLARSIRSDAGLPSRDLQRWTAVKEKVGGKGQFDFSLFDVRPLREELLDYAVNDVIHLPRLYGVYNGRLGLNWRQRVDRETATRLDLAKKPFLGHGQHRALSPFA